MGGTYERLSPLSHLCLKKSSLFHAPSTQLLHVSLRPVLLSVLLLSVTLSPSPCTAQKRRIHIDGNLEDIVDSEEDEEWKAWGKRKEPKMPKNMYDEKKGTLDTNLVQEFTSAKTRGPAFGFVKLTPNPDRKDDDVFKLAGHWQKLLYSGHVKIEVQPVDIMTLWYELDDDRQIEELIDFFIEQDEAHEFRVGDRTFRRPENKPLSKILGYNVWKEQDKMKEEYMNKSPRGGNEL